MSSPLNQKIAYHLSQLRQFLELFQELQLKDDWLWEQDHRTLKEIEQLSRDLIEILQNIPTLHKEGKKEHPKLTTILLNLYNEVHHILQNLARNISEKKERHRINEMIMHVRKKLRRAIDEEIPRLKNTSSLAVHFEGLPIKRIFEILERGNLNDVEFRNRLESMTLALANDANSYTFSNHQIRLLIKIIEDPRVDQRTTGQFCLQAIARSRARNPNFGTVNKFDARLVKAIKSGDPGRARSAMDCYTDFERTGNGKLLPKTRRLIWKIAKGSIWKKLSTMRSLKSEQRYRPIQNRAREIFPEFKAKKVKGPPPPKFRGNLFILP